MITNGKRLIQAVGLEVFLSLEAHTYGFQEQPLLPYHSTYIQTGDFNFSQEQTLRFWFTFLCCHIQHVTSGDTQFKDIGNCNFSKKTKTKLTKHQTKSILMFQSFVDSVRNFNTWSFLIPSSGAQPALLQHLENFPKTVDIQHKQIRQYNNILHHFACSLNRPGFKKYEHFN